MASKTHKPHPKCECGRPLFKSFEKGGRVTKDDPYKFCRSGNCPKSGPSGVDVNGTIAKASEPAAPHPAKPKRTRPAPGTEAPPTGRPPSRARVSRAKPRPKIPEPPKAPEEHPGVAAARARIRELVKNATAGAPKSAIGLVLALVTQETGNKAAANLLIKEHKLDELFGLQAQ